MKRSLLPIILLLFSLTAMAQTISVKSFKALTTDMTASSLEGKRIDQNGDVAALIRVVTPETGFMFEGGTLGIVDTKQKVGEIWVWVPRGARKISIMHQQLGVLREYRYPIEIEAERTYEMVLTTAKIETIVTEEVKMQYLAFEITPPNAILVVNDEYWNVEADGTSMKFVDFGTYTYRVQAPNYHPDAGKVTVDDPENAQKVIVNLKPDFVEVTLKVDADAEIWVNNEKKGVGVWTGPLGRGTYKMECKQVGHETTVLTKEITDATAGQTITLPAPKPIYGSLNVESSPNFSKLYIDGKAMGETPKFIGNILVGPHEVKLTKNGYTDHVETVTVKKGERAQMNVTLKRASSSATDQGITQPRETKETRKDKSFFVTLNGAYAVSPQWSFGVSFGQMNHFGWFVSLMTNGGFRASKAAGVCYANLGDGMPNGWVYEDDGGLPYYNGEYMTDRNSIIVGGLVRLARPLYFKAGVGYGFRNLYWLTEDDTYYLNASYSYKGLETSAGLQLDLGGFVLSLETVTTDFKYLEGKLGLGYAF